MRRRDDKTLGVSGDNKTTTLTGKAERTAGKIQKAVGGMKDTVREIVKK